tara:strand:- start:75 stop:629 length:555 start_codon:yes stop_codon:yes gene_type:complete
MLQFRIQSTPNPSARKYVLNEEIKAEGKVSYKSMNDCEHVPLAFSLLAVPGIKQVHFFENILTITQDGVQDWSKIDNAVQTIVIDKIRDHDIFFEDIPADKMKSPRKQLVGELKKMDEILDRTIRPSLQMDGGDVELMEYEKEILTVKYLGACEGCPSSMMGTLEAMKSILREEINENLEIVAL